MKGVGLSPPARAMALVLGVSAIAFLGAAGAGTLVFGWTVAAAVVLYGCTLWGLTLCRNLFLDLFVLLSCVFYYQRMVLVGTGLSSFRWERVFDLSPEGFLLVTAFLVLVNAAMLLGYLAFRYTATTLGFAYKRRWTTLLFRRSNFESYFRVFALLAVPLVLLSTYLRVVYGVGVPGVGSPNAVPDILQRVSTLAHPLLFLPWLALLSDWVSRRTKLLAVFLVILFLVNFFVGLSRAAFISVVLVPYVLAMAILGKSLRWKHVLFVGFMFFLIPLSFVPITALRGEVPIEQIIMLPSSSVSSAQGMKFSVSGVAEYISWRLGGFDRLVGIHGTDWSQFGGALSPIKDLKLLVNSFVPGELLPTPGRRSVPHVLSMVLTGRSEVTTGYGINPMFVGRGFIYFGYVGTIVLAGVWSFVSVWVVNVQTSIAVTMLYLILFGFSTFVGSFPNPIFLFVEGLLVLLAIRFITEAVTNPDDAVTSS